MTDNSNQFLDALKEMQGVEVGNIVNVEVLSVEMDKSLLVLKMQVWKV